MGPWEFYLTQSLAMFSYPCWPQPIFCPEAVVLWVPLISQYPASGLPCDLFFDDLEIVVDFQCVQIFSCENESDNFQVLYMFIQKPELLKFFYKKSHPSFTIGLPELCRSLEKTVFDSFP